MLVYLQIIHVRLGFPLINHPIWGTSTTIYYGNPMKSSYSYGSYKPTCLTMGHHLVTIYQVISRISPFLRLFAFAHDVLAVVSSASWLRKDQYADSNKAPTKLRTGIRGVDLGKWQKNDVELRWNYRLKNPSGVMDQAKTCENVIYNDI